LCIVVDVPYAIRPRTHHGLEARPTRRRAGVEVAKDYQLVLKSVAGMTAAS